MLRLLVKLWQILHAAIIAIYKLERKRSHEDARLADGYGDRGGDEWIDQMVHLREIVDRLIIDPQKFTDYALNPENPVGADKARVFQSALGFTQANYELLLQQIADQALDADAIAKKVDEHGWRYQVDLAIVGVESGQQEAVRTGWIVAPDSNAARLVTLYVLRRQR